MRGKWSTATVIAVLCLLSAFVLVSAECPNGCSGSGDCMAKDMCNCYKNYQGNDCGDRTCAFGRAHVDTPKGDIDMDKSRLTPGWILTDSQQAPAGTYEHFSPDAAADEAHFYMECSNKGICDRSTGLCQCFDGYEGVGCRRTTCPSKCNGHGTCESIRELGVKAAGTLFGKRGDAGAVKYDLWDGNSTHGCRCDPWYHGPDCSKRSCKVGVDPLFMGVGVPTYETFVVHAATSTALDANSWIRLRMFDYYGESYITQKIKVTGTQATDELAVAAAIKAIPNLTFKTVTCASQGTGSLAGFLAVRLAAATLGMSVVCQLNDNPGRIRLPEIASSNGFVLNPFVKVTTTTQQGFDNEWFTLQSTEIVAGQTDTTITLTLPSPATVTTIAPMQIIKIEDNIMMVKSIATNVLTLEFAVKHTISVKAAVFTSTAGIAMIDAGTALVANALVGDDTFSFAPATAANQFAPGDMVFFHNQFFRVLAYYAATTAPLNMIIKLDRPFGGNSFDGDIVDAVTPGTLSLKVYKVTVPTDTTLLYKYVSECSGRGMCGYETGICSCFKGYTDDNCDTQNIIAV